MVKTTIKAYRETREELVYVRSDRMDVPEAVGDVYDWCSSTPVMLDLDDAGEIVNHRLVTSLEV